MIAAIIGEYDLRAMSIYPDDRDVLDLTIDCEGRKESISRVFLQRLLSLSFSKVKVKVYKGNYSIAWLILQLALYCKKTKKEFNVSGADLIIGLPYVNFSHIPVEESRNARIRHEKDLRADYLDLCSRFNIGLPSNGGDSVITLSSLN